MKRATFPALLSTALTAGLAATAFAGSNSDGTLSLSAANQSLRSGCANYPIAYSVSDVLAGYSWNLQFNISKSGSVGAFAYASGDGPSSGTVYAFLCDNLDGHGTFSVQATLTSYSDTDASTGPSDQLDTTLVICAGACPVPRVRPSLAASIKRGRSDVVIAHLLRSGNPMSGAWLTLWSHPKSSTRWTTTKRVKTGGSGWATVLVRPKRWTAYRWTYAGSSTTYAATSGTVHS